MIYVLIARDNAGHQYTETGNDRAAYERFISRIQSAQNSGMNVTVEPSTASSLNAYSPGIFSDSGALRR